MPKGVSHRAWSVREREAFANLLQRHFRASGSPFSLCQDAGFCFSIGCDKADAATGRILLGEGDGG